MADEMSRVHRFMVGDRVSYTTAGNENVEMQEEGEVKGFANEELTHLSVLFDEHDEEVVVTEDELRRLA